MITKVKSIHFIESIPCQPIYLMENGEIRIPFPDGKTSVMLWCSEAEAVKALTSKSRDNIAKIRSQFNRIKAEIIKSANVN